MELSRRREARPRLEVDGAKAQHLLAVRFELPAERDVAEGVDHPGERVGDGSLAPVEETRPPVPHEDVALVELLVNQRRRYRVPELSGQGFELWHECQQPPGVNGGETSDPLDQLGIGGQHRCGPLVRRSEGKQLLVSSISSICSCA